MIRYRSVNEIEYLYEVKSILESARKLWYRLAEGIEFLPTSYRAFVNVILDYEKNVFTGWKLCINENGSLTVTRNIDDSIQLYLHITRGGNHTCKILPLN